MHMHQTPGYAERRFARYRRCFFAVPGLLVNFKVGIDAALLPEAQAGLTDEQRSGIAHQPGLGERVNFL